MDPNPAPKPEDASASAAQDSSRDWVKVHEPSDQQAVATDTMTPAPSLDGALPEATDGSQHDSQVEDVVPDDDDAQIVQLSTSKSSLTSTEPHLETSFSASIEVDEPDEAVEGTSSSSSSIACDVPPSSPDPSRSTSSLNLETSHSSLCSYTLPSSSNAATPLPSNSSTASFNSTNTAFSGYSIQPPTINDLISQSFINPELTCDSILDSLEGGSGSDLDSDDSAGKLEKKQRLPLEDFMRKIVLQINSTTDKVWPNLLLDFTKSFAEYQVPYNGFASNDFDLLLDILNIAMKNLESEQADRRVFASRLLLNINELLNGQLIRTKVMPILKRVLDGLLETPVMAPTGAPNSNNDPNQATSDDSTVLRFNLCFVLAHFAQRLGFCYFVSHLFPYFEKLALSILQSSSSSSNSSFPSTKSSISTDFALLDSMIFLLSTVLHYNEVLSKKCSPHGSPTKDGGGDFSFEDSLDSFTDEQPTSGGGTPSDHRHMSIKEVFDFISDRFIPLVKRLFEALLASIIHYRTYGLSLEQESLDCFIQWKDQNRSTNESIIQTTYGHYQTFIFFILLLRDYLKKSCYTDEADEEVESGPSGASSGRADHQEDMRVMAAVMEAKFTQLDQWYRLFYAKLVRFMYEPPERSLSVPKMHEMMMNSSGGQQEEEKSELMNTDDDEVLLSERKDESTTLLVDDEREEEASATTSTILVNNGELTKINLLGETTEKSSAEESSSTSTSSSSVFSTTTTTTSSSFIGKFQLTESKVNAQQQQQNQNQQQTHNYHGAASGAVNAALLNNSRIASIREHQLNQAHHFSSSVSTEIFGFYEFKTLSCKAALINSIPILFDLYYITQSNSELASAQLEASRLTGDSLSSGFASSASSEGPSSLSLSRQQSPDVYAPFVLSLNAIVVDPNPEIVLKMMNVFHKLIARLPQSMRFYSFLVNVLHSQNVLVLANLVGKISDMLTAMLRGLQRMTPAEGETPTETHYIQTAIESILGAFLRSEAFLSTKPNWRLYIQFLEVLLELSRMVPPVLVKKMIVPRLLMRFSSTRHIPCRQAITRCLLIVYLEQFAAKEYDPTVPAGQVPGLATLGFDLFQWFDANLRTSPKYQQRQVYLDVYGILLRLLFDATALPSATPGNTASPLRQYFIQADTTDAHLYLVDLLPICPKLHSIQWDKGPISTVLRPEAERLRLVGTIVTANGLLEKLVSIICEDRVATIRASAASVLHSLIVVMKHVVIASHLELEDASAARTVTAFLQVHLLELLFERAHLDKDRLTVGQLKRLLKLINETRQDLHLAPRSLSPLVDALDEEKTVSFSSSGDEFETPIEEMPTSETANGQLNVCKQQEEILDEVYILMDELLARVQEGKKPKKTVFVVEPVLEMEKDSLMIVEMGDPEIEVILSEDVPMLEIEDCREEDEDEELEVLQVDGCGEESSLESSLGTLTVSTPPSVPSENCAGATCAANSPSTPASTCSPRRGIIVLSAADMMMSTGEQRKSESSGGGKSKKKSKKSLTMSSSSKSKSPPSGSGSASNSSGHVSKSQSFSGSLSANKLRISPCSSLIPSAPYSAQTPASVLPRSNSASAASSGRHAHLYSKQMNSSGPLLSAALNSSQRSSLSNRLSKGSASSSFRNYELRPMNAANYQLTPMPPSTRGGAGPAKGALLPTPTGPMVCQQQSVSSKLPVMQQQQQQQQQQPPPPPYTPMVNGTATPTQMNSGGAVAPVPGYYMPFSQASGAPCAPHQPHLTSSHPSTALGATPQQPPGAYHGTPHPKSQIAISKGASSNRFSKGGQRLSLSASSTVPPTSSSTTNASSNRLFTSGKPPGACTNYLNNNNVANYRAKASPPTGVAPKQSSPSPVMKILSSPLRQQQAAKEASPVVAEETPTDANANCCLVSTDTPVTPNQHAQTEMAETVDVAAS